MIINKACRDTIERVNLSGQESIYGNINIFEHTPRIMEVRTNRLVATPRHATPRHTTPRHTTPQHTTPRHATPPTYSQSHLQIKIQGTACFGDIASFECCTGLSHLWITDTTIGGDIKVGGGDYSTPPSLPSILTYPHHAPTYAQPN